MPPGPFPKRNTCAANSPKNRAGTSAMPPMFMPQLHLAGDDLLERGARAEARALLLSNLKAVTKQG